MRKLSTIQKRNNLNSVFANDEIGPGGANHVYEVRPVSDNPEEIGEHDVYATIEFQKGPRSVENSVHGVLDTDLLEIVRDRLKSFQAGEFSCRENACALTHVEEALMWMNHRVEERAERGVLGTNNK